MDVSFISATLVIPAVVAAAPSLTEAIILVKPQFEAGRQHVGKGGTSVTPKRINWRSTRWPLACDRWGWEVGGTMPSPITGAEGNREFLLYARRT